MWRKMARKDDKIMKRIMFLMVIALTFTNCFAQDDAYLRKMTDDIVLLRKGNVSNDALNKIVIDWSASNRPKIALMDEIKRDDSNEYRSPGSNKFKMNQLVAYVYDRQKLGMTSKGDYFNSTEKDIHYSVIEKNVKKGCTVKYKFTGHIGNQEFVFIPFNLKARFLAKINGKSAEIIGDNVRFVQLPQVCKEDVIEISITNNSSSNESFVILNHNPQK